MLLNSCQWLVFIVTVCSSMKRVATGNSDESLRQLKQSQLNDFFQRYKRQKQNFSHKLRRWNTKLINPHDFKFHISRYNIDPTLSERVWHCLCVFGAMLIHLACMIPRVLWLILQFIIVQSNVTRSARIPPLIIVIAHFRSKYFAHVFPKILAHVFPKIHEIVTLLDWRNLHLVWRFWDYLNEVGRQIFCLLRKQISIQWKSRSAAFSPFLQCVELISLKFSSKRKHNKYLKK